MRPTAGHPVLVGLLLCLSALGLLAADRADAGFGPATLLSGTPVVQFEEADAPALSADGRYAVFQGSLAGVAGIYRRDLQDGQVELVAGASTDPALDAPDASSPSVSADGRYVAFTSSAVLVPAAAPGAGCPQVYVRDMGKGLPAAGPGEEGLFTLASARDGSVEGLSFAGPCSAGSGAQAAPGVALSADGEEVVFSVSSASDLTGPCVPGPPAGCPTPPGQVAVRDLATDTTTLMTVTPEGEAVPGGAFPGQVNASSAAISADGSTVAWIGSEVPAQVPSATDVVPGMAGLLALTATNDASVEVEPLWRRVAGPGVATRRLLAGSGLQFYARTWQTDQESPAMGGALSGGAGFPPPALSADGDTVATLADALSPAAYAAYQSAASSRVPPLEGYVVDMGDGAEPRVTALTETRNFLTPGSGLESISDLAISPDGTHVAFDTSRDTFALPQPRLTSPPVPSGDYTYEVDLPLGTIGRVTTTWNALAPSGPAGLLAFSGDRESLAFASAADNLFFGDGVVGPSEVYLVHELPGAPDAAAQTIGPAPTGPSPSPRWTLTLGARTGPGGRILVSARVPGAGRLALALRAQLPGDAVGARRSGARAARRPADRLLAAAGQTSRGAGPLHLKLRLPRRYAPSVDAEGGLYCVLTARFRARGHAPLKRSLPLTVRRAPHPGMTHPHGGRRP